MILGLHHLLVFRLRLLDAIDAENESFSRVDCTFERHEFLHGIQQFAKIDVVTWPLDGSRRFDLGVFHAAAAADFAVDRRHCQQLHAGRIDFPL